MLAVAISGGSDSLALTFLLHQWATQQGGKLHAFHVNHHLRPSSTEEAHQVKGWLDRQNIPCTILTWHHNERLLTHLQEKARKARYALLDAACAQQGILHLATAHHFEDQQETYWMRKQCHSTDYGLAGMSAVSYFENCRLIRPLLCFTKEELRTILGTHPYLEDPSNQNTRFRRAQLRQQPLAPADLAPYQTKRRHEEKEAAHFLAHHAEIAPEGYGKVSLKAIETTEPNILARSLACLLRCIGNGDYFPHPASVENLIQKWSLNDYSPTSLGKCVVFVHERHAWVVPDRRLLPEVETVAPGEKVWHRFVMQGALPTGTTLKPLGPTGWQQICARLTPSVPYAVALSFPAYWSGEKVVGVPFLNFFEDSENYPSFVYIPKNSLLAEFFV